MLQVTFACMDPRCRDPRCLAYWEAYDRAAGLLIDDEEAG